MNTIDNSLTINRGNKNPEDRHEMRALRDMKTSIKDFKVAKQITERNSSLITLRRQIHDIEVLPTKLTKNLLDSTKFLGPDGLGAIVYAPREHYPTDIHMDAVALFQKLDKGNMDNSIFRGTEFTVDQNNWKPLNSYKYCVKPNYAGEGNLRNGQWWPIKLCALRDGAHGNIKGGIHHHLGQGVFSIVLGGNPKYQDIDEGDTIQYCSTEGNQGRPSHETKSFFKSYEDDLPIRVLRSSNLDDQNIYRPEVGYRYDGLYHVTGYGVVDEGKQKFRFYLARLPGQTPIRFRGLYKRPSVAEVNAYWNGRKKEGVGASKNRE